MSKDFKLSARDRRVLTAHILHMPPERLLLEGHPQLSSTQTQQLEDLIIRRQRGEPLSKLIGEKEFWSRPFFVSQDVLDPRPDSETLIDAAVGLFKDHHAPLKILDLGTGSGCLIITLLCAYQNASGVATDISPKALEIAKKNSQRHGLTQRLDFIESNWFDAVQGSFDLIISNPPYIRKQDIEGLDVAVRQYDPPLALDGGESGVDPYKTIISQAKEYLTPNGNILFEIGHDQATQIQHIAEGYGFSVSVKQDLGGRDRCLLCRHE